MPLNIIVIGAGIAGLCAAISLRQAGHSVKIFEKSFFATETGAAILITPNGARVLSNLGLSFERARACVIHVLETCNSITLERTSSLHLDDVEERFGAHVWSVHRVDLHQELLRLALDGNGAASLHLGVRIRKVDHESGNVELEDGSNYSADLVVAADGVHSLVRSMIAGEQAIPTGRSAYRYLLPTKLMRRNEQLSKFLDWKTKGTTIISDTADEMTERTMTWYDCHSGEIQNFVGIIPTKIPDESTAADEKALMLEAFADFHPAVIDSIRLADDVKCWNLCMNSPLPTWVYGKVVLIGDAAHAMLPVGGQGSNQAIEDGGALGYLLHDVNDSATMMERLKVFEAVRRDRASRVQLLSKVRVGKEKLVEQELQKYASGITSVPTSFPERIEHYYGFDVREKCAEALAVN